jgi:F-box and leucine-rich repeat protein 14
VESIADIDALITDTVAVLVVGLDDRKIGALSRLNALRHLYQEGPSHVTDKGLCALVTNPLEVLDLAGSVQITDRGLKELRLISSLRWLGLTGCERLTELGIAELRAALPQCEIEA